MFENVDDGRTTDAGFTGILIAHLGAFGSGELINEVYVFSIKYLYSDILLKKHKLHLR